MAINGLTPSGACPRFVQVLGKAKQHRTDRQPQQHHHQHGTKQAASQPQHQQPPSLRDPPSLLRRSVAAVCTPQCPQPVVAAAEEAASKGWGPIASLALWQGVGVVEMAHWLLQLSAEERQQVLAMYSEDVS